ncbi:putative surface anchored protein [Staphylococcus aureus]|nr:YSIRK-type signal peptide-containing protein [Staphylococcus aureus]MCE7819846.1 YSIRK-type signal peptide-containing protein [Staphylococcus aureus]CYE03694.1 putative surface anchored protein [Staphylococcus aureus]
MNLLKKNKYSIRKYKVGIFSTLIGTVLLLSNPNGAQALTTDQNVQGESNQALPGNSHNTNVDTSRDITNSSQNTPNQHTTANASTNQALANHHNVGESNPFVICTNLIKNLI